MSKFDFYLNNFSKNKRQIANFSYRYAKDYFRNNFAVFDIKVGIELEFYLTSSEKFKKKHHYTPITQHDRLKLSADQFATAKYQRDTIGQYAIDESAIEESTIEKFIWQCNSDPIISSLGKIKKEQGVNQLEYSSLPYQDLLKLCTDLDKIKKQLNALSKKHNFKLIFKAFTSLDDCPSSLQFNISYVDQNGNNVLKNSPLLQELTYTNLLDKTNHILFILAPSELDYYRYHKEVNKNLFSKGKYNSPVNLSVGINNRSCAVRIPNYKIDDEYRIEYRVASSDSNHWLALSAILLSLCSVGSAKNKYPLIYGNAFDENYNYLTDIFQNIDIAKDYFFDINNNIFKQFLKFCSN